MDVLKLWKGLDNGVHFKMRYFGMPVWIPITKASFLKGPAPSALSPLLQVMPHSHGAVTGGTHSTCTTLRALAAFQSVQGDLT